MKKVVKKVKEEKKCKKYVSFFLLMTSSTTIIIIIVCWILPSQLKQGSKRIWWNFRPVFYMLAPKWRYRCFLFIKVTNSLTTARHSIPKQECKSLSIMFYEQKSNKALNLARLMCFKLWHRRKIKLSTFVESSDFSFAPFRPFRELWCIEFGASQQYPAEMQRQN